jgi:hypothetical protein
MKKILFLIILAGLLFTGLQAQKKQEFNWQKIGEKSVDFKTNKDAITIGATDNFKALQIKTADAPVHIDNLVVVYESGDPENIPVRYDFKANSASRAINLSGAKNKIKEIDVVYRAIPNWKGDKAQIEIWGSK